MTESDSKLHKVAGNYRKRLKTHANGWKHFNMTKVTEKDRKCQKRTESDSKLQKVTENYIK